MIGVKWEGPDGSLWDLRDGSRGVQLATGSLLGLRNPSAEIFTRQSSFVDGQAVTGWKLKPRDLELPLDVHGDTEEQWFVRDRALQSAFRIDRPGRLIVTDPLGGTRYITARLDPDDPGLPEDPAASFATSFTISLVADDPWYYGTTLEHTFANADPARTFYGPTGYGPPFYLAPTTFTGADVLYNPGDAPAWGKITIPGPIDSFSFRIGGREISGFDDGYTVPEGRTLTIDTNPQNSAALLDDGTNITRRLGSTQFAPIPDGSAVPVEVIVFGDTVATLSLTPRYMRGW